MSCYSNLNSYGSNGKQRKIKVPVPSTTDPVTFKPIRLIYNNCTNHKSKHKKYYQHINC